MSGEFRIDVVDRFSAGIPGAQVVVQQRQALTRTAAGAESVAETNIHGRATFRLEAGKYRVRASKPEYRAEPREAELRLSFRDGQASPSGLQIMLLPRIDSGDLADDAVGYEHIGADAVNAYQIADDAVTYEHIAGNAVAGYQIADRAVAAEHIADDAIVARHVAPGAIGLESLAAEVRGTLAGEDEPQVATAPVAGRVIVARRGGDHPTVGAAVAALGRGAQNTAADASPLVIDVLPGVYQEPRGIRLPPQVSLRGAGRECTEIRFATGGLIVDRGNECAVSGVTILSSTVAIRLTSCAVRVDNCFVSGGDIAISAEASTLLARGNILRKGRFGVRARGCAVRLLSNEIEQFTECGVVIRQSNARVLWNTLVDNGRDLDVREMQGGRRCLVSFNILRDIVADQHARTRVFEGQNLTVAAAPLEPWEDL